MEDEELHLYVMIGTLPPTLHSLLHLGHSVDVGAPLEEHARDFGVAFDCSKDEGRACILEEVRT